MGRGAQLPAYSIPHRQELLCREQNLRGFVGSADVRAGSIWCWEFNDNAVLVLCIESQRRISGYSARDLVSWFALVCRQEPHSVFLGCSSHESRRHGGYVAMWIYCTSPPSDIPVGQTSEICDQAPLASPNSQLGLFPAVHFETPNTCFKSGKRYSLV